MKKTLLFIIILLVLISNYSCSFLKDKITLGNRYNTENLNVALVKKGQFIYKELKIDDEISSKQIIDSIQIGVSELDSLQIMISNLALIQIDVSELDNIQIDVSKLNSKQVDVNKKDSMFIGVYELESKLISKVELSKKGFLNFTVLNKPLKKTIEYVKRNKDYPKEGYFYPLTGDINTYKSKKLLSKLLNPQRTNYYRSDKKFKYNDRKFMFQALTIPIKIRPSGDKITKYTASTNFNVGIAAGLKINYNRYINYLNSDEKFIHHNTKQHSLSFGVFGGPTIIELDSTNTSGHVLTESKAIGITTGLFTAVGIRNFNIGIAMGHDIALGDEERHWKNSWKWNPWLGFVFSISLIK